jgi:Tol biopolymer transport system component
MKTTTNALRAIAALTLLAGTALAQQTTTFMHSLNNAGVQLPGGGHSPVISPDGSFLVFATDNPSTAAFMVGGSQVARNSATNLWKRYLNVGQNALVSWISDYSIPPQLGPASYALNLDGYSSAPSIASNGMIAFQNYGDQSYMTGLAGVSVNCLPASGLNGYAYIDNGGGGGGLKGASHEGWVGGPCGSLIPGTMNGPVISPDGTYLAFSVTTNAISASDTNGVEDVYVKNLANNTYSRVSVTGNAIVGITQGNGASSNPALSTSADLVVFESTATNFTGADLNGAQPDIFARSYGSLFPSTERISKATDGTSANGACNLPDVSADGRYVIFESLATNLAPNAATTKKQVYLRDRTAGTTTLVSRGYDGLPASQDCFGSRISKDGKSVVFYSSANNLTRGDVNGFADVFVYSIGPGAMRLASTGHWNTYHRPSNNNSGAPSVSDLLIDGSVRVAFQSNATNLTSADANNLVSDVFIRSLPALPSNDTCANALPITPGVEYLGSTGGAAADMDASCASFASCPDVFFTITSDRNAPIVVDSAGSNYDSALEAYDGCGGAQLGCNDDAYYGTLTSKLAVPATTGQTIIFRLAGFEARRGEYKLHAKYQCGDADVGVQGGIPGTDGYLDNNDFVVFISMFFNGDNAADFGKQGGIAGPDGQLNNNDFIVFIDKFFGGC